MEKIRISAVKYANTYPFIYGLTTSGFTEKAVIETDHPADCASKLLNGKVDIGLVPVAVIPLLKEAYFIGDYCIGANGRVRTVQLMSNTPINCIDTIYLDYRSRTSVNLVKVLAKNKWKTDFRWAGTSGDFDFEAIGEGNGVVLIGDQCFELEEKFRYRYDLAMEWKEFSGLPFVFACWIANRVLPGQFIDGFNSALETGVENIDRVVEEFSNNGPIKGKALYEYLTINIDFDFNEEKKKGMKLFHELLGEL